MPAIGAGDLASTSFPSSRSRTGTAAAGCGSTDGAQPSTSVVRILISDSSVRCTGQRPAISTSRARCSASSGPVERDPLVDLVDPGVALGLAVGAVARRGSWRGAARPRTRSQRPALALGVEAHGHRRAGAQRRQQQVVGTEARPHAADALRLVGDQACAAGRDPLLEPPARRSPRPGTTPSSAGAAVRRARPARADIARGPGREHAAPRRPHPRAGSAGDRPCRARRSSWGAGRRRRSATRSRCPTTSSPGACMTSSARPSSLIRRAWSWPARSVTSSRPTRKRRPAIVDLGLALRLDRRQRVLEQPRSRARCRTARRWSRPPPPPGTRSAAARIAAPPRLCPISSLGACVRLAQGVGRGDQVGDVGAEGRAGELALAGAEAGEVEAQRGDTELGQAARELGRRLARPCRR